MCHLGSRAFARRDLGGDTTVAATGKDIIVDAVGMVRWPRE